MERRQLVRKFAIGAVSAGTLVSCSRGNQFFKSSVGQSNFPRVEWRMATSWPESLDLVFGTAKLICDRVSKLTTGNFVITPFPAGGIAPPLEILDSVQVGGAECGHTAGFYYTAKNPTFAFSTSIPFGLSPSQHMAWLYSSGGLELLRKFYAGFNVINFPAGGTGNQMGGWFKKKVESLADLKGLKMRTAGLAVDVMQRLGFDMQKLPPSEIAAALQRGTLDAAEWIGPYDDEKLGLNKFAQFYYYPGWNEPGSTFEMIINQTAWGRLPKEYQEVLSVASFEAQLTMLSRYEAANRQALQRLVKSGTQLLSFSTDILNGAEKAAFDLYEEYASKDTAFREIYDHWKYFRKEIYGWSRINELPFDSFSYNQFK